MGKGIYCDIDMTKTGILLKDKIFKAGYSVKEIQEILRLSCPQPVYRWFKGKMLPSLDNLYVLSDLLGVHMEELVVPRTRRHRLMTRQERRLHLYCRRMRKLIKILD